MTEPTAAAEALSPIKRALLEIRELRAHVASLEGPAREPIAITGIALRFPGGADDVESFARLLWDGVDAIAPIPPDRWNIDALFDADPDAPGKMFTRHGGFIDGVDQFDAEFFGINPREAASMDPQQRLLMHVAWEALEDAGQSPATLMGSRAGVYLGISNNDYGRALFAHPELIDVYFSPGNAYSVASGRLSYFLGAQGPAVSVDTACSSSLVALHLACQALRGNECDLALAGGVNLILTPEMNINFSKARMMAPDGRCKTFDARADGYVRGEGVAFVVLERLSDAQRRRRRIYALVRGSAVNQDGRSNGLTAPNGPAQEAVIRAALENAGVRGVDVSYVETHGTGTLLGDPIEVQALGAALGGERSSSNPLMIGSVKTNVGHLEAAAGVAGIVKAALVLQRAEVPPHLNFVTPSPLIDWPGLNITVPTKRTRLPHDARPRLAGVSSFGFSGTNAHVILAEAPQVVAEAAVNAFPDRPRHVLPLSARGDDVLRVLAQRHHQGLATCTDVAAWCHAAGAGRAHFAHRLSVSGSTRDDIRAGLAAYLDGRSHPSVVVGHAQTKPRVAFLFTGQGPQHVGMARTLYEALPVFRLAFDACAAVADPLLPASLHALLYASANDGAPINDARLAQPALFAVEFALAAVWRSWGVEPTALLGHSFGEYVAAALSGVMSTDDAMRAVISRTQLVHEHAPAGAMAAIFASEEVVSKAIAGTRVVIATLNGPDHVVISGPRDEIERFAALFEDGGTRAKVLHVSYGSHSPLMDPVLAPFAITLRGMRFSAPEIPLVSNLTGTFAENDTINAAYWGEHLRHAVRFADAMRSLAADGITHYIEIGPHPVLLGIGAACVAASPDAWLPSLRRDAGDWATILASVQQAYAAGAAINWIAFDAPWPRAHARIPVYPFRTKRYWMDSLGVRSTSSAAPDRWALVSRAMDRAALQGPLDLDAARYPRAWDALAQLTNAYAARFLHRAGLFAAAGETRSLDDVMRVAQIGKSYRHLMRRRLDALADEGVLRVVAGGWSANASLTEPDMAPLWANAERELVHNQELLAYVRQCATLMDAVLTGRESPLETLFPGGSSTLAVGLYQKSQTMRWVNGLASAAFDAIGAAMPSGQAFRVLEVGAGTGGTTAALLPLLAADRTQYTFTDVSDFFFHESRERFEVYPFVRFARFDVDADPTAQGFAPGSFDAIMSANAVHASKDLRAALARLRDLLAPGGMLVLIESTTHHAWFDMTTGLIEGWQHFADDLRGDHPLLDATTWTRALRDAGFVNAASWPGAGSVAEALGQHVIIARVAGELAGVALPLAADVAGLQTAAVVTPAAVVDVSVRDRLATALPDERAEILRDIARDAVVRVLRLDPADAPSRKTRLMELGIDSLMAVQLRNLIGQSLGLGRLLPATLMFDYPTIDALAGFLETHLEVPATTAVPMNAPGTTATPGIDAADIAAMSDDEIERLLLER